MIPPSISRLFISALLLGATTLVSVAPASAAPKQTASSPFAGDWRYTENFVAGEMNISSRGRVDGFSSSFEGSSTFSGTISNTGEITLTVRLSPLGRRSTAAGTAYLDGSGNLIATLFYSHGGSSTVVWIRAGQIDRF
jgi:hypothetical protein